MTDQSPQFNTGGKSRGWRFYIEAELVNGGYLELLGRRVVIYLILAKYAGHKTRKCWPSYKTMMDKSGYKGKSSISETIRILEGLRLIEVKHSTGKNPNIYNLLDPKWWQPINGLARETVRTVLNERKKRSQKPQLNSPAGGSRIESTSIYPQSTDLLNKELKERLKALGDKMRIKPE